MATHPKSYYCDRAATYWGAWGDWIPFDNVAKALRIPKRALHRSRREGSIRAERQADGWFIARDSARTLLALMTDPL